MTEVVVDNAEQYVETTTQAAQMGAGQLLRQAREQQHMTVQALASALKVPSYKVQALEEERWDLLTDSVFTRALALSICRLLHIPTEPVLAGMPKHEAAKLASNPEGINAPFKEKSLRSLMSSSSDSHTGSASKVGAALLVAVAIGAGLYFLPQWQSAQEEVGSVAEINGVQEPLLIPALPQAQSVDVATPVSVDPVAVAHAATAISSAAALLSPETASANTPEPTSVATPVPTAEVVAPAMMTPALVAVEAVPAAQPAASSAGRMLRFTASAETWVQVRDAKQQVLMEKILKSGDVYEQTLATHPVQVVVGNANATKLEIDGAAWDLTASAKNNVARFEVK
jgi:cytoskeleton protein RodZ